MLSIDIHYLFFLLTHRFNKREEDFPSLRDYNDYLEEVEDMSKYNISLAAF